MPKTRETVALLGVPVLPPAAATRRLVGVRAGLRRLVRSSVPPSLHLVESLLAIADNRVLGLLVEFDIPEMLTRPRTLAELSTACGAEPDPLARVLRYATARGFVATRRDGRYQATRLTRILRRDHANSWRGWVAFAGSDWFWSAWRHLDDTLRGEGPGIEAAFGTDFFTWAGAERPEAGGDFHEAMRAGSTLQAFAVSHALDWTGVGSVCDVGGGTGAALEVLLGHHPELRGALFDRPEVVASARPALVDGLVAARAERIPGDFFVSVPPGYDRYLLLAIVHDWDDARAGAILRTVGAALDPSARAVVVEQVMPERPRDDFAAASDLLMLTLCSGRERTAASFKTLFAAAGLAVEEVVGLATGFTAFVLRSASTG